MSLHLYPEASSKQLRKLNPNDFATTIICQFFHHVLPQKKQLQPTQPTQHAAASPIRDLHLCQGIWLHERIHVCFEGWNPDGFGGLWGTCTPPHREPTKKKQGNDEDTYPPWNEASECIPLKISNGWKMIHVLSLGGSGLFSEGELLVSGRVAERETTCRRTWWWRGGRQWINSTYWRK